MQNVGIIGVGHFLPPNEDTNERLCETLTEVDPAWILEKTGIRRRFLARPTDSASSMCIESARRALAMAKIEPSQLDLIVVCTFSADYVFPPVSAKVQHELGAKKAQIFDLQANCSGFVTGLTVGADRLKCDPDYKYALIIGAELHTRFINRTDKETAIFFSDGAGAAVLEKSDNTGGILSSAFFTDATNYEAVRYRGGGSSQPNAKRSFDPSIDFIEMNGLATWRQAITHLPKTIRSALAKARIEPADVNLYLFHQANKNLIEYVVRKFGQPLEKTLIHVDDIGNTGAASVAIILSEAVNTGKLKKGDCLVLAGVGAGFNFASSVWRWNVDLPVTGVSVLEDTLGGLS
jgi:3-oxoacyl-[acyl-carrier-protein] synthase-3